MGDSRTPSRCKSLFATVNVEGASELYMALRDGINERCRSARDHCDELWREFSGHEDVHFDSDFPAHLHERWFEMYLTVAFWVPCRVPEAGPRHPA